MGACESACEDIYRRVKILYQGVSPPQQVDDKVEGRGEFKKSHYLCFYLTYTARCLNHKLSQEKYTQLTWELEIKIQNIRRPKEKKHN